MKLKLILSLILAGFVALAPQVDARSSGSSSGGYHSSGSSYHSSSSGSSYGSSSYRSSGSSSSGGSSWYKPSNSGSSWGSGWGSSSSSTAGRSSGADNNTASSSSMWGGNHSWFSPSKPNTITASSPVRYTTSYSYRGYGGGSSIRISSYNPTTHVVILGNGRPAYVYHNYSYGGDGFWDSYGHFILLNSIVQSQQPVYYDNSGYSGGGMTFGDGVVAFVIILVILAFIFAATKGIK